MRIETKVRRVAVAIVLAVAFTGSVPAQTAGTIDFAKDVLPILRDHCFECHGPSQQMEGLRLDRRRDVEPNRVGANRAPVVPGNSAASGVYVRISDIRAGRQMPPSGPLTAEQIKTVKSWIESGADWPDGLAGGKPATLGDPSVTSIAEALRDGDRQTVTRLLRERPALASAKGNRGWTALMYAAAFADAPDVQRLLKMGADPNAQNDEGATALMYSTDDVEKTRILLASGANPNLRSGEGRTALIVAASGTLTYDVAKLLIEHGADAKVRVSSRGSALQAAVLEGDLPLIRLLLEHGADPKGLYLGSLRTVRCRDCMDLLMESAEPADLGPALSAAAMAGDAPLFARLLDRGAKPSSTTLQFVAISPVPIPAETIRRLIGLGADVKSAGQSGLTARELARRHRNAVLLEALAEAGVPDDTEPLIRVQSQPAESVRGALDRSIPALQRADVAFIQKAGCVSCHNNSLTAMAVSDARAKRVSVDERIASDQSRRIAAFLDENRERALENIGLPGAIDTVSYVLLGLAAAGYPSDSITDAWAKYVNSRQAPDGSWRCIVRRPPLESSDFQTTAASIRVLKTYGARSRRAGYDKAAARGTAWLEKAQPITVEDRAFQILGLVWGGGSAQVIRAAARSLLALQEPDGGWAQLPGRGTEAYSSGQALVALRESGAVAPAGGAFQRGMHYLLNSQLADGSWHVASRSIPLQPMFDSDFPHGPDQFISAAATSWASMALTSALK